MRIVLVGCGIWGRNILASLLEIGVQTCIVDPSPAVRTKIAAEFGVDAYPDASNLGEVDGFIIATPASTHAKMVLELLRFDRPIFVEKPLTTDLHAANQLLRAGRDKLFVMHIWRYHAGVKALAEIAKSGELGTVNLIRTARYNWTSPRLDVDSIWTLVPHDVSIAIAILGHVPPPIFASVEIVNSRAAGMLAVLGDAAPQMIIDASTRFLDKQRSIRLHCQEGVAWLPSDAADHFAVLRDGGEPEQRPIDNQPPLTVELRCFVEHLRGGPPPPTGVDEGVNVVETITQLRQLAGLREQS